MSSLQGTFNTAVQAMLAQSQEMTNISTNIANVNTNGYKSQSSHFMTLLNESGGPNSQYFAVQTTDSRAVDTQGNVENTGRKLDLEINGRGFFVTNTAADGSGTWEYTRDGSFSGQATTLSTSTNGVPDQGTYLTTASGNYVYGWKANADGTFPSTNDTKSLQPILISNDATFPAKETTTIGLAANVAAGLTGRQSVGLPFVDASGNTRTVTVGFTNAGASNWTLDMSSTIGAGGQPVTVSFNPPQVSFDTTGKISAPPGGLVTATINDPSGPQTVTIDMSKVTQYGGDSSLTVENITQDGYIAGQLQSTAFNSSGVLVGTFSNGETQNLYQLPVATFQADQNLNAVSGNVYTQTASAGALSINAVGAGTSPGGTQFVDGALESSNVDLSDQFSKMIVTQQAYSSASQVLRTADEMTQAARDLIS